MPEAPVAPLVDLDRRRIELALRHRARYRYVRPRVEREGDGWRVVSPCCSRNVDAPGGEIEIALLRYDASQWHLYAWDRQRPGWVEAESSERIHELLDEICLDPKRIFWP